MAAATHSLQLYSLRDHGAPSDQLDIVRDAGFTQVETFGPWHADAGRTRAMLDERGLSTPSGHFPLAAFIDGLDETVRTARALGHKHLVMPWLLPQDRPTDAEGWAALGVRLGEVAWRVDGEGFTLSYHNHDWEMAEADGAPLIDHLFRGAGGAPLRWQADLAWVARGGADPEATIARLADRLLLVHVKDIARPGENLDEDGWADPGHGTMDWRRLVPAAEAAGAEVLIAEHDKPKDARRFAKRANDFLTSFLA